MEKGIREKYEIYANYNNDTIRVYQAYNDQIADEAIVLGTFGESFRQDRMTWIKPSFLWMMYRSGWGQKENQNRILAIDIKRTGFDFICDNAVLSSYLPEQYFSKTDWQKALKYSDIRCQWDPERDIYGNALPYRTIQLGLKGKIIEKYVSEWIMNICDITKEVNKIKEEIYNKTFKEDMLPLEKLYVRASAYDGKIMDL